MLSAICHACLILYFDKEQITQGSLGFQEKSNILAVWPAWINNSSGPSSASSRSCSPPILFKYQSVSLQSVWLEAKIVLSWGNHWTWNISSLCDSEKSKLSFRFLRSHKETVLSADLWQNEFTIRIERKAFSISSASIHWVAWFGSIVWTSILDRRFLISSSWPRGSWSRGQETPTALCPVKMIVFTSTTFPSFGTALMSHRQMVWSSEALSKCPQRFGFQESP